MITRFICFIFGHKWQGWTYADSADRVESFESCLRCGEVVR